MQSQGGKYPCSHVLRSNVATDMLVLRSSTCKGGLDLLYEPESNFGDHMYYYFVSDWPGIWTLTGRAGEG